MDKLKTPEITINGKTYKANVPKVKAWHDFVAFDSSVQDIPAEDVLSHMCEIVAGMFDIPSDFLIDNLAITDIKPLYRTCFNWVVALVNSRMDELPKNGERGAQI